MDSDRRSSRGRDIIKVVRYLITTAIALAALVLCSTLAAQDLEPRAYSNSPTGLSFLIVGYGYAKGGVLIDPSMPLDNVTNDSHLATVAFATTLNVLGKSAKFDMVIPWGSLLANGVLDGAPRERYVVGFSDPAFRFSINFIGAPALTAKEFSSYHQDFILGASFRVVAPLGQYNDARLINIGSNRWSFKPEIGMSKALGRWTLELKPAVTFYTDNGDFFNGQTRKQAPIYSAVAGVSYTFTPGCWLSLDATHFKGGRTTVDDVENLDEQQGTRIGATFALPVTRNHSVKFYASTGYNSHHEHNFEAYGIAWQYRWGGGF